MSDTATPKPGVIKKAVQEPEAPKKAVVKKPFELQPRLTARPFKEHPGLADLKKHLGKKK